MNKTFKQYEEIALSTNISKNGFHMELAQKTLGLTGESGEVAEKVKKFIRGDFNLNVPENKASMVKELGDVLWYLTVIANLMGSSLEQVAEANNVKLLDRLNRNKIQGDGDNR